VLSRCSASGRHEHARNLPLTVVRCARLSPKGDSLARSVADCIGAIGDLLSSRHGSRFGAFDSSTLALAVVALSRRADQLRRFRFLGEFSKKQEVENAEDQIGFVACIDRLQCQHGR
jgi:hypothetical protein